jgi:uncharacterized protein (TIGR02996 family)
MAALPALSPLPPAYGTKAAFLRAIHEQPQDDTPRLIYADWLEEHDNGHNSYADRAEFIRIQCQLASAARPDCRCLIHKLKLEIRERELLAQHREEWMRPLRQIAPGLRDEDIAFARGFPARVTLRRVEDLEHAEELAGQASLKELHLYLGHNDIGAAGMRVLASSPHLQHLTHLFLADNGIGDAVRREIERAMARRRAQAGGRLK